MASPTKAQTASGTNIRATPFAHAHPFPRGNPLAEKPTTNSMLFYEDRCREFLVSFYDNTRPLSRRLEDAFGISACLPKIGNEDLAEECFITLLETMQIDSEHPSLRMACAVALGSSGMEGLVARMEELLKSDASIPSKLFALKALSICRSDGAIGLLGNVALYGDKDQLCLAAATELLGIPLYPAQKIVRQILSNPPEAFTRNPEFMAEFRRLAEDCPAPLN